MSLEIFIDIKSYRSHYGPGVYSGSNRNEYQEHFLGGKGGRCVRLTTLPPSCAVVMKSGNLNFLQPSGPLQACNGTALPGCYNAWSRDGSLVITTWLHTEWPENRGYIPNISSFPMRPGLQWGHVKWVPCPLPPSEKLLELTFT